MLYTNLLALALATLAAAEPSEAGFRGGDKYLGTVYRGEHFRGPSKTVTREGQCFDLSHIGDKVRSIKVDDRDQCTLYRRNRCDGRSKRFTRSERFIHESEWKSVRCTRERRHH